MKHISLGGLDVSRIGLGAMAMSGYYLDPGEQRRRVDPHHPPGAGPGRHPHRHRRDLRPLPQRGTRRPGHQGPPRRGRAGDEVRHRLARRCGAGVLDSSPANIRAAVEGSLKRLGHRPHRPLLPAPGRPEDAHRGHRRRPGRAGRRGQGPPHRPVRGRPRDDPPRPRRAPDHRAADRVLPVDPRPGGRAAAAAARAGHRLRSLLAARPRLPHRHDPLARAARRRRLAQDQPALHRRELRAQPAHRRRGPGRRRRGSAPHRRRWPWPGCSPRATTSPRSPAPSGSRASRRTPPPTASS